jgi:prolipoprotein diacylglyceryltransferase
MSCLVYENLQTKILKTAPLPVVWYGIMLGLSPKGMNLNRYYLGTIFFKRKFSHKERESKRKIEKFV